MVTTNLKQYSLTDDKARSANKGLAKVAVQWLIEQLCFVFATFAKPRNVIGHWKQNQKHLKEFK